METSIYHQKNIYGVASLQDIEMRFKKKYLIVKSFFYVLHKKYLFENKATQ